MGNGIETICIRCVVSETLENNFISPLEAVALWGLVALDFVGGKGGRPRAVAPT